jgi:hypothetical protein
MYFLGKIISSEITVILIHYRLSALSGKVYIPNIVLSKNFPDENYSGTKNQKAVV